MTHVTLVGNLTGDPQLRFTPSGAAVCEFSVAHTPRTYDKATSAWVDGEASFYRCKVWREAAEHAAESLTKGQRVIVTGILAMRKFERRDGTEGLSAEVEVEEVGPSLRWATAAVTRTGRRDAPATPQGSDAPF